MRLRVAVHIQGRRFSGPIAIKTCDVDSLIRWRLFLVLFAVVDYLLYRFQRGSYSPRKLEADVWFLADESSLDKLKSVRNGDVLFSQPINSFTSWVVMYFQGGPCSHVGTLTNEGTIVEAITAGVVERPASVYFDGKHYLTIRRLQQMDEESGQRVVFWMRSRIGNRYGWGKVVSLGLHILIGNHWDWRPRISFDVLIFTATKLLKINMRCVMRRSPLIRSQRRGGEYEAKISASTVGLDDESGFL